MRALILVPLLASVAHADPPTAEERAKMNVCSDGKDHYVVVAPHETNMTQLLYGDAKAFHAVPPPPRMTVGGDWFEEPRYWNKTYNSNFRGLDLRGFSHVDFDQKAGKCEVTCGERTTRLTILPTDKAQALLGAATFGPPMRKWAPYALARDDQGKYYYVDRGFAPEDEKNFRLFVGPKGGMKQQKMTNVVSDSEGDIFATKSGSLRMIIDKKDTKWVDGKNETRLLWVPVADNLRMIFNDLGVYTGERLGTPCDDL
jgi:hypothetical protein